MGNRIRHFLVVDDQEDVTLMMARILSPLGECVCVNDSGLAVSVFEQALQDGRPFDAVFMDILMPGADGHETAGALRKAEQENNVKPGQETRLIMISSLNDVKSVSKAFFRDGLADGYLTKPLSVEGIREKLQEFNLVP
jgi:two-component system chemotaxis response regulator CheY